MPANNTDQPIFFYNFRYIDPVLKKIHPDMRMVVKNGIISQIGMNLTLEKDSCLRVNLQNQYILPGLINSHCHLAGSGKPLPKFVQNPKFTRILQKRRFFKKMVYNWMKSSAQLVLEKGITTVRSLGEPDMNVTNLRDDINRGDIIGARILTCGRTIASTDDHDSVLSIKVANVSEAKRLATDLIDQGVDCLKLMATGSVTGSKAIDDAGRPLLSAEIMAAISNIAHRRGVRVTAHCESNEGTLICLQAGLDSLEHGSDYTPEMLDQLAKNQIGIVPTLAAGVAYSEHSTKETGLSEIEKLNDLRVSKNIAIGLKRALLHGKILIGVGDDAGIPLVYHGHIVNEIKLLYDRYDMAPFDCIACATINNAKILGMEDKIGSLEPGKYADFIGFHTKKNPMEDLELLSMPDVVYKEGIKI